MPIFQQQEGETFDAFAQRIAQGLYPPGAKHCMMHCQYATSYEDGSGAYCNNQQSEYYRSRVRSWDTVDSCKVFSEEPRLVPQDHEEEERAEWNTKKGE